MSMLFTIINKDKPGTADIRQGNRPAHLDYLNGLGDAVLLAGPFLDEAGASTGSLIIIRADSLTAAQKIAADDPFVAVGLFASSEVTTWKWTVNAPEGL